MVLSPLAAAPVAIQLHAAAALALVPLTIVQWARPKRGPSHRTLGWCWVALMVVTAVSSFFVHQLRVFGPFSPIHILSVVTLVSLTGAIIARRAGRIASHRRAMAAVTLGWALAGLFTLMPGRILHDVVLG